MSHSVYLKAVGLLASAFISLSTFAVEQVTTPADVKKFQSVLAESKLQLSSPEGKTGNKKDLALDSDFSGIVNEHFYVDPQTEDLVFTMKGYKNRSEIRVLDNFDTSLADTRYRLSATIKPVNPRAAIENSDKKNDAMTFLQVHNSGDGTSERGHSGAGYIPHPLLRIVYEGERSSKQDHYWAIIKNNAVNCGSKSGNKGTPECKNAYLKLDLGAVKAGGYSHFDIIVGGSALEIKVDGETLVNHDISYWKKQFSYFKAGVYNQFKNGTSEVHFKSLEYAIE
ncbi:polysaccharide lyase family 7 protein [Marinomonas epiphytica]